MRVLGFKLSGRVEIFISLAYVFQGPLLPPLGVQDLNLLCEPMAGYLTVERNVAGSNL
jgi:hypothetical protein